MKTKGQVRGCTHKLFGHIPNNLPLQTHKQGRASHQCSSNGLRKTISSEIDKFYANRKQLYDPSPGSTALAATFLSHPNW